MSKLRIHLGDRIHSREVMDHLVKGLLDSRAFQSSLEKVVSQGKGKAPLEIFLKNLRRCLVQKADQGHVARLRLKDKTL